MQQRHCAINFIRATADLKPGRQVIKLIIILPALFGDVETSRSSASTGRPALFGDGETATLRHPGFFALLTILGGNFTITPTGPKLDVHRIDAK